MIYTSNCILSKVVSSTKRKCPLPLFRAHRSIPSILKARIKRERTYPSSLNPPSLTLFPFSLPTYPRSPPQHPNKDAKNRLIDSAFPKKISAIFSLSRHIPSSVTSRTTSGVFQIRPYRMHSIAGLRL